MIQIVADYDDRSTDKGYQFKFYCDKWVRPEVCWNSKVSLYEACAPNFEETVAAPQAAAKSQMVQEQVIEKVRQVNYATDLSLRKDVHYRAPSCLLCAGVA
jgi:hypothetical protein